MKMLQVVNRANPKEFKILHLVKVELALGMKNLGVVGIDLSGNPGIGEWMMFLPALEFAKKQGLSITHHCGEVVGWRLVHEEGWLRLQCWWKVRDTNCAEVLISRINRAVESTGHVPTLRIEEPNEVRAELWTSSIGGLSMNDFIVAAKTDGIKTSDLIPRKRVWA